MPDRHYADEWLPSRFGLATLRVVAYVVSTRLAAEKPRSGASLSLEKHQHPLEAYLLALAYWLIPTAHVALLLGNAGGSWSWLAAAGSVPVLLVAVPNAWVLLALLMTPAASRIAGWTGRTTHDVQALVTPSGMLALAAASVVCRWPGQALGWLWIGLTVLEIIAVLACVSLRARFAALERRLYPEVV